MDDSPYNLLVLQELIKDIDFDIEIYESMNGEDAVEKVLANRRLMTNQCEFTIILMDLHMPVMDGFLVSLSI